MSEKNVQAVLVKISATLLPDYVRKQVITVSSNDSFKVVDVVPAAPDVEVAVSETAETFTLIRGASKDMIKEFVIIIEEYDR